MVTRLVDEHGDVHADGCDGNDTTLCGDSRDGEDGAHPMRKTKAMISCCRCVSIVLYAKRVRPSEMETYS